MEFMNDPTDAEKRAVTEGLAKYNERFADAYGYRSLSLVVKDESGNIIGGLLGCTYWRWLCIEILWVRDDSTRHGIGSRLLGMAETEAIRRGCGNAHLDTHDFQAVEFYEKHGYSIRGELPDLPHGHTRYLMAKRLISVSIA
jgi:GNAT superfamily N-acetyltransferase